MPKILDIVNFWSKGYCL